MTAEWRPHGIRKDVPIGAKVRFRIAGRALEGGEFSKIGGPIGRGGRHLYLCALMKSEKGTGTLRNFLADEIDDIEYKPVNLRRMHEVEYIIPFEAVEAHSLFARPEHAISLAAFLRSKGVRFTKDSDAIQGEINFLADKSTPWDEFVAFLNEWKRQFAEGSTEADAAPASGRRKAGGK